MIKSKNIFLEKKILIYGLGKSVISSYKFLNNKAKVYLFDDNLKKKFKYQSNQRLKNIKKISKIKFDRIIISPGIDVLNCKLSKFLKKNLSKIYTDLDIFYSFYKNKSITITGTNGKSTTAKILHEVLLDQKYDTRLIGNIGNPALSEKRITESAVVFNNFDYTADFQVFPNDFVQFQEIFKDTSDAGSGKSRQNVHKMWIPSRTSVISMAKETGFITFAQVDLLMAQLEYQYLYVFQKPA